MFVVAAHDIARAGWSAVSGRRWITTPSGLELLRALLVDHLGEGPDILVVDCELTLRALITTGRGVTLASSMTHVPANVARIDGAPVLSRTMELTYDPRALTDGAECALHESLVTAFRQQVEGVSAKPSRPIPLALPEPAGHTRPLEFDDIYPLEVVRRTGSVNRAAAVVALTQPALTRRIQRLEAELDMPLLRRSSRGSSLTPVAERLVASFRYATSRFEKRVACILHEPTGA